VVVGAVGGGAEHYYFFEILLTWMLRSKAKINHLG
jgi:hypothetical protein